MTAPRSAEELFQQGIKTPSVLGVGTNPVSSANPVPVTVIAPSYQGISSASLVLTNVPQSLPNIPADATAAEIVVEKGNARITTEPPAPTATTGQPWADGDAWRLDTREEVLGFQAVIESGAPALQIRYLKVRAT